MRLRSSIALIHASTLASATVHAMCHPLASAKVVMFVEEPKWPEPPEAYEPEPMKFLLKVHYQPLGDWGHVRKQTHHDRANPNQPFYAKFRKPVPRNGRRGA